MKGNLESEMTSYLSMIGIDYAVDATITKDDFLTLIYMMYSFDLDEARIERFLKNLLFKEIFDVVDVHDD